MTAPAQNPHNPQNPPDPQDQADLDQIAGLLTAAGSVGAGYAAGLAAAAGITLVLRHRGLSAAQATTLLRLDAAHPAPPIIPTSPALRAVFADGPTHRARYLLNAAKRITTAAPGSDLAAAAARELRYFHAHQTAQTHRQQSAQRLDAAANAYGPLLGWNAVLDERTTLECRHANGRNFYPSHPPKIGLPGLGPHSGCRCWAGPAHTAARMVDATAPRTPPPAPAPEAIAASREVDTDVSIDLSARTAHYAATPAPRGRPGGPGLFGMKGAKLPNYIEQVVKGIIETGVPAKRAYPIAIGKIRDWAEGKGDVSPEVRAASVKAISEWEALRAKAHVQLSRVTAALELAAINKHHVPGTAFHWFHNYRPRDVATALLWGKKVAAAKLHKQGAGHFNPEPASWWASNPHEKKTIPVSRRGKLHTLGALTQVEHTPAPTGPAKGTSALGKVAHGAPDIQPSQKEAMTVQAHAFQKAVKTGKTQFVSKPGEHLVLSETKPPTPGTHVVEFTPTGKVVAHLPNGSSNTLTQPYLNKHLGPHFPKGTTGDASTPTAPKTTAAAAQLPSVPEASEMSGAPGTTVSTHTSMAEAKLAAAQHAATTGKPAFMVPGKYGAKNVVTTQKPSLDTGAEENDLYKRYNPDGSSSGYTEVSGAVLTSPTAAPSATTAVKGVPKAKLKNPPTKAANGLGPTNKALYNAPDITLDGNEKTQLVTAAAMQKAVKTGTKQYVISSANGHTGEITNVKPTGVAYKAFEPDGTMKVGYGHTGEYTQQPSGSKVIGLIGLNYLGIAPGKKSTSPKPSIPGKLAPLPDDGHGTGIPTGLEKAFENTLAGDYMTSQKPPLPGEHTIAKHFKANSTITKDEKATVHHYTGSYANKLNGKLRTDGQLTSVDKDNVAALDAAAASYQTPEAIIVKRGLGSAHFPKQNLTGEVIQDSGYMSTSFGAGFPGDVRMNILVPKGTHGISIAGIGGGQHPSEQEFLMPRGTQLIVHKDQTIGGTRYITATVVPAPTHSPTAQNEHTTKIGVVPAATAKLAPGAYGKAGLEYLHTHGRSQWLRRYSGNGINPKVPALSGATG